MKISVAMATYNGADYLQEQLESITRQTRLPDEMVVTDDGSDDGTMSILSAFVDSAPFEVIVDRNPERLGFAQNFSRTMCRCTGDLVFLSDQDDCWLPNKVEAVERAAENNSDKHLFMNDAHITDERLAPSGQTILSRLRRAAMSDTRFVHGSCTAVRRPLLDIALPVPAACPSHDNWIVGLALDLGCRLILEQPLQYYRRHGESSSQSVTADTDPLSRAAYSRRMLATRMSADTMDYLQVYLALTSDRLARVQEWLERAPLEHPLYPDAAALTLTLTVRGEAIRARMALLKTPRNRRARAIVAMLRRGQYGEFAGARTALRDLFV